MERPALDWNLIVRLGALGAAAGLIITLGYAGVFGTFLFFGVAFYWALTIGRQAPEAPWKTAILAGTLAGLLTALALVFFFYDSLAADWNATANAVNATANRTAPLTFPSQGQFFLFFVARGIQAGLLTGLGAWAFARSAKRQLERRNADPLNVEAKEVSNDSEE